jgi:hypothetical protein
MVASKYFLAWRELLIHVFKRKESRLSNSGLFKGKTLAVDVSSWFQADMQLHRDYAFGLGWRFQHYAPERMMEMFQRRHERLLQLDVKPLYVFPGRVNPKRLFRDRELNALEKMRDFYRLSRERRIMNASEQKRAVCTALHLCHLVHPDLVTFLADWMKNTLGVPADQIINAPFETVWQLRELERTHVTAGTISNDCTLAMIGGQKILVFAKFTGKRLYYQKFNHGKDIELKKYNHDFRGLSDYLPEAMTLFETDYYQRVNVPAKHAIKKDFPNYVIDHQRWLMNGGGGNGNNYNDPHNPPPMDRNFAMAANMLRYGPVVRSYPSPAEDDSNNTNSSNSTVVYKIEPLNPLPAGVTWKEAIGFDPIADVLYDIAPADYGKAMRFEDGQSFIVPPSSQPSNIPGFDEMRCVVPKKPKRKRLSKKEKKQLRAMQERGELLLPDDMVAALPQADDKDKGENDDDYDDDSSSSSSDSDSSDVHSGTDLDDDSDDDVDDDYFSDDDDDDEEHPDDTTTPADPDDDDEQEKPSPSNSKRVKTDLSLSETKHGTTTATTTITTSSPAPG